MSGDGLRIVSLVPSGSEIVAALGLAERLVGRSHECDHPPGIERLPACTRPRFETGGPSRVIDARVRELLERALSIYDLDTTVLERLQPSHIITQDQCAVCAVDFGEVERAVGACVGAAARVISLQPEVLDDVWGDVERVGSALGVDGGPVAARLRERVQAIAAASAAVQRKRVVCLEWADPLMAAGNWIPEMVRLAGGEDVLGAPGGHAPRIDWQALEAAEPDVIVFMPCGFDRERTRTDAAALARRPGWSALRAARAGEVYVTDANRYFSRPGPRLVESLEILAEILHPEVFSFGHAGDGWQRL